MKKKFKLSVLSVLGFILLSFNTGFAQKVSNA